MNKIPVTIRLVLVAICLINFAICEIRFAFEMFRHGARGPLNIKQDGKDIYGETWNHDGELTEVGMRQHYLIGYRNRQKYKNFLSTSFDPKEMYVISTNVNRTIMSAYSQLQGLFPDGTGPELNEKQLNYALPPIGDVDYSEEIKRLGKNALPNKSDAYPIHLFDYNARYFYLRDSKVCPGIAPLIKENLKKEILKNYMDNFNQTYGETFQKILNVNSTYFYDYWSMYGIADTFVSDVTQGKELNVLKDAGIDFEKFNKTAFEFLEIDILEIGVGDKDKIIPLVSMSPIVLDVLKWMEVRIKNDINSIGYNGFESPKFVMYSAHDVEMGAIQLYLNSTLTYPDIYYTPFASSIFFELYRPDNVENPSKLTEDDYEVLINYNDHFTKLPFTEFKKGISENSYDAEKVASVCQFNGNSSSSTGYVIATFSLGVITLGLIIYVVYNIYKNRKNQEFVEPVPDAGGPRCLGVDERHVQHVNRHLLAVSTTSTYNNV